MSSAPSQRRINENPFLSGNFAPRQSEGEFTDLRVQGTIPEELEGYLLRIGPNPLQSKSQNWFMAPGMVHGLRLQGGQAKWFKNKFVVDNQVADHLGKSRIPTPDNSRSSSANTNILMIGGDIYALQEAGCLPVRLDCELNSLQDSDFGGTLKRGFTAHPRKDPTTGELHCLLYEPSRSKLDYLIVDGSGHGRYAGEIEVPSKPMVHDTAITKSFVVVLDLMITFSPLIAMTGNFPYVWNNKKEPRIGLFARDRQSVRWFDAPTKAVYHIANAFESGDQVIVDVVVNATQYDGDVLKHKYEQPCLMRWIIDTTTGKISETQLSEHPVEFPRLNDSFVGTEYKYTYTAMMSNKMKFGPLFKHNVLAASTLSHDFGPGKAAMEPVFVARAGSQTEDDGWLLSYVFDENTDTSEFVILDAQNFEGPPVAVVPLPVRVPYGFHGNWILDSELLKSH